MFCAIYLVLNIYSTTIQPFVNLDINLVHNLNYLNIIGIFVLLTLLAFYYHLTVDDAERELRQLNIKLELLASIDPLTKLFNRRAIMDKIKTEAKRSERSGKSFVIVLADIDDFKMFNDDYGHDCGDEILMQVAGFLKKCLREQDHTSRWGGEEFLIVLPETNLEKSRMTIERIREQIAHQSFIYHDSKLSITLTFGLAEFKGDETVANCIIRADKALRDGKRQGKNCIVG